MRITAKRTQWAFHLGLAVTLAAASGRAGMVVISEIMSHPLGSKPEYLVLLNTSATPFDIARWRVTEGVAFEFPDFASNRPAASFLGPHERIILSAGPPVATRAAYGVPDTVRIFGPWEGKLNNDGERVTVADKNGVTVCTVKYGVAEPWPLVTAGHSLVLLDPNGRVDDWRNWTVSASLRTTPGARTEPAPRVATTLRSVQTNIVINEIMFDPPPSAAAGEYLELFNRGADDVNLAGWELRGGVRFTFSRGANIPAGGFIVVARDTNQLRTVHGGIPLAGNFAGKLDNAGELVRLVDSFGHLADEVDFKTGGDWPELARGGGSSLELVNPWLDNARASAWRDSDEPGRSEWQTFACTNTYLELNPFGEPSDFRELHLHLAGDGHVALRNLALLHGGTNLLAAAARVSTNGTGTGGWLCQGTHWASYATNGEFHLVADGRGDDRENRVEMDVPGMRANNTYVLKFDARWVSGSPRLIAQTWDHSLGGSFLVKMPGNLGTPGRANSRFAPTPPPQVDTLTHHPAVPRSTDSIKVSAQILSATPLAAVKLWHRADRADDGALWQSQSMRATGDGTYAAELSARQTNGQIVQFYVEAVAENGHATVLPRGGATRPALLVVDDRALPRDLRTVRLVVSARDLDAIARGGTAAHGFRFPRLSNHYFNATFISDEAAVFHGAEVRNSGSVVLRTNTLHKPKLKLPADRPFRGRTRFEFDDDAAAGTAYHNRVARYLLYLLGHPANDNEFVRVVVNAGPAELREDVEPVDNDFLERNFADGRRGELYRIDDDWRLRDDGESTNEDAQWAYRDGDDARLYRSSWVKRTRETEDDFSRLIAFFKTVSRTNYQQSDIESFLDPRATLKLAAVRGFIGDWDTFTMLRGHNGYLYRRPADGLFQFLHWDSDEGFLTGQPLYGRQVKDWIEQPYHRRLFSGYVAELLRICADEPARLNAWLQAQKEAAGPDIRQANYANFFKARAPEVRAELDAGQPLPQEPAGGALPPPGALRRAVAK